MRRLWALLTALAMALACCALGEEADYIGEMTVVNCEEYVSLRAEPSTSADRLAKVNLGETVYDCSRYDDEFIQCSYEGATGYILAKYLEASNSGSDAVLNAVAGGCRVVAERAYIGGGETMTITCTDPDGARLWSREERIDDITELTSTDAFLGGTAQEPRVMVYNSRAGLFSLNIADGSVVWTLTPQEQPLGGSISHAVGADGTMYIGGYYGPDPVAVSMDGGVLWAADPGSNDIFWLYELQISGETLLAHYDYLGDGQSGWITYDLKNGNVMGARYDE